MGMNFRPGLSVRFGDIYFTARTRLAGIKTGSSCQLEPAVAAGACWVVGGAKLVLGATVYLGFFTGGASTGFSVERLRVAVVVAGC